MKRHVKKLINNCILAMRELKVDICEFYDAVGWRMVVGTLIAGILVICMATDVVKDMDLIPATVSDYEPLERQAHTIEQNPDLLWKMNCNIEVQENRTIVELRNDKCELIAEYDHNFKLQSTKEQQDNYRLWYVVIPIGLVSGGICWFVCSFIITAIICLGDDLLRNTYEKIVGKKSK